MPEWAAHAAGKTANLRLRIDDFSERGGFAAFYLGRVVQEFVLAPIEEGATAYAEGDNVAMGMAVVSAVVKPVRALDKGIDAARALPSPRTWLLDNATDQTLRNRINMLYRPNARIGNGGTADAVRYELQTGQLLSPKGHFEKAILERDGLLRDLASGRLNETDTRVARQLLSDLQHALQGQ